MPEGVGIRQEELLEYPAEKGAPEWLISRFKSMSSKKRNPRTVHALHYAVYPMRRMLRTDFESRV